MGISKRNDYANVMIVVMVVLDSLHFVFARLLTEYLSPLISSTYMILSGTLIMSIYMLFRKDTDWSLYREQWLFFLVTGALIGGGTYLSFEAVKLIDPGLSSLFSKTGYIFSLCLSWLWLRETVTTGQFWGSVVAITGVLIILFNPIAGIGLGAFMAVLSALLYSIHAAIAKKYASWMRLEDFFSEG